MTAPRRHTLRAASAALLTVVLGLAGGAGAGARQPAAQPSEAGGPVPEDRILAVVDDDPILDSDLRQVVALGLMEPLEGEDDEALRRRVLEALVEQRLRFHEIDRFGFAQVPVEEVEEQYRAVEERLGGPQGLAEALREVDLDPQGLRQLLARQLMVVVYVEERLGPRIFVSLDDIQAYYEEVLTPEMADLGEPLPRIDEVREPIRALLKEGRLNEEIARWTGELRAEADVIDYFERGHEGLPPVVGSTRQRPE